MLEKKWDCLNNDPHREEGLRMSEDQMIQTIQEQKEIIDDLNKKIEELTEELDDFKTAANDAYDSLRKVV